MKKILIFSTISPVPTIRGDRTRLFQTAKNLSTFATVRLVFLDRAWESCEYDFSLLPGVEIISLKVAKSEMYAQIARSILSLKPYAFYKLMSPRIIKFFLAQMDDFKPDIFWAHQIDTYPLFREIESLGIPKVLDIADSISLHYDAARKEPNPSLKMRITSNSQINLDRAEKDCICQSDRLIVSSHDNIKHLTNKYSGLPNNLEVVHVHVDQDILNQTWKLDLNRPNNLLFVGYLAYPPNALAVSYVIEEVLPKLKDRLDVNFIVCGSGEQQLAQKYKNNPNIIFKGFVKDLSEEYLNASAMISPAPFASGVQTKLVEAMAIGLPSIISAKTLIANGVIDRTHVVACESADDFADAVIDLMTNQTLANTLSSASKLLVVKEHTSDVQTDKLREIVAQVSPN